MLARLVERETEGSIAQKTNETPQHGTGAAVLIAAKQATTPRRKHRFGRSEIPFETDRE